MPINPGASSRVHVITKDSAEPWPSREALSPIVEVADDRVGVGYGDPPNPVFVLRPIHVSS